MLSAEGLHLDDLARVVVIGPSCAGKSTFAHELARLTEAAFVELDYIAWCPDWVLRSVADQRASAMEFVAEDRWVIDGNYTHLRDIIWPRATALVWLNYPFHVVWIRAMRRTARRVVTGEAVCNGNRETIRQVFFSRNSILRWVWSSYRPIQDRASAAMSSDLASHAVRFEFGHPRDARQFMRTVRAGMGRQVISPALRPGSW